MSSPLTRLLTVRRFLPLLGTGKTDYTAIRKLAEETKAEA